MSKEMVISANRHETRVALLEDDQLVEVHFQRAHEYSLAGSIHKGRVTRVLPGMQSAFVDLGLERDTFLYVSDFLEENEDIDQVTGDERPPRERGRDRERRQALPPRQAVQPSTPQLTPQDQATPVSTAPESAPAAELSNPAGPAAPDRASAPRNDGNARPDGRNDDRRGRRSRRRRNRGRGIPDSKYAETSSATSPEPVTAPVAESEPEPEASSGPQTAPLVLPGESLRKYRSAPDPGAPHAASLESPALESAGLETASLEVDEENDFEVEGIDEYNLPVHYPPENALPDAPIHHPVAAEPEIGTVKVTAPPIRPAGSTPGVEAPPAATSETMEPELRVDQTDERQAQAHQAEAESGPAVASLLDEDEDRDIQAMILGEVEGMVEELDGEESGEPEESSRGLGEPSATPGAEAGLEAAPAEPESGSAEVRERGGRYPHRVSRRGRRRTRGPQDGRPQEGRPDARGETPAPTQPQERVVTRPTQPSAQTSGQPSISDLLKEGQEIIVQIAKEPLGQKGARITSHIALPGRYVVYMPTLEHTGVSRKIASDDERLRLKRILQVHASGIPGGFIVRTAGEGKSEEDLAADMNFLFNIWLDIRQKAEKRPAPLLLHHDLDIVQRTLRDQFTDDFKAIWVDNEELYESVLRFVQRFQPSLVSRIKLYTRSEPIFDAFNITQELEKALRPKVWLKSGGYIVINQTEALVAIDINTGKYVGKSARLEDTIVKTNTDAVKEIVRQIRLRDLGGIIVVDFIDMDERKNRQKVMQALEDAMRSDRAPYKILQFNDFGLVAITRKRVKQSLERALCSPCPYCEGAGYVKSVTTVIGEILQEAQKIARAVEGRDVVLRVNPEVAKVLKSNSNDFLQEIEETLGRPVLVKSDPQMHQEKFDLA